MRQREGWSRSWPSGAALLGTAGAVQVRGASLDGGPGDGRSPGSVTNTTSPRVHTLCQAGAVLGSLPSLSLFFAIVRDGCCPFHFTGEKTEDLGG